MGKLLDNGVTVRAGYSISCIWLRRVFVKISGDAAFESPIFWNKHPEDFQAHKLLVEDNLISEDQRFGLLSGSGTE